MRLGNFSKLTASDQILMSWPMVTLGGVGRAQLILPVVSFEAATSLSWAQLISLSEQTAVP